MVRSKVIPINNRKILQISYSNFKALSQSLSDRYENLILYETRPLESSGKISFQFNG
jgi:hypothetical protein